MELPMDIQAIMKLLPHRNPFLLVDRIIELEAGKRVVGIKNVTLNEPFFPGHFPGHPVMPGVLILEAMAQTGGVLLLSTAPDAQGKLIYFMSIDGAKFRRPVMPGDQLRMELTVLKLKEKVAKMAGKAFVGEHLAAEGEFTCMVVDR
jgi:UDP-3-O-[3-hydroxymyristoyl] N-acetylglucosamine deacetylase/3-hydroxyacyl-[acyl-carrier-protein] dehydratase